MDLEALLKEKVNSLGYDLISVNQRIDKGDKILFIVVDRVKPIDMEAIVALSRVLNDYLDELSPIEDAYTLDISSLGAEKPLKMEQLPLYVGSYIHVHLINPINGENIYEGDLVAVTDDNIKLSYRQKTRVKVVDITKANISKIRLAIKF